VRRFWAWIETPFQPMAAWVDEGGRVLRFHLRAGGAEAVDPEADRDPARLAEVQRQVTDYCEGRRRDFDLELAPDGPAFEQAVWQVLRTIPFGTTTSYGAVARAIGQPGAARAVGAANNANPIALIIPCHRVIGADGQLVGYGGGLALKRKLLEHEARVCGTRYDLFG
jgi:methylated-DNA-[protein]-cysteine S-methyltransferase